MANQDFQGQVRSQLLGSWAALPHDLYKLLASKTLNSSQYVTLQYIFTELYRCNKFSGQFSVRHLCRKLGIADRTIQRALRNLEAHKFILRHFNHENYGETYTLNVKAVQAKLSEIGGGDKITTPNDIITTPKDKLTTVGDKITIPHDKITTNIRFKYISLYSLYIKNLDAASQESLEVDITRLIDAGFTGVNIKSFLELHSKNGVFDLKRIDSFYAVVKSFGKSNLDQIETAMAGQRLAREKERQTYAKALEQAKNPKTLIHADKNNLRDANKKATSFKIY